MRKIFSVTFWIVMGIHVAVFTGIALFTDRGWKLLLIFLAALAVTMVVKALIALYARRHPEKKTLGRIMGTGE